MAILFEQIAMKRGIPRKCHAFAEMLLTLQSKIFIANDSEQLKNNKK